MTARTCRLVVEGELDDHYAAAFDGMTINPQGGNTVLEGTVRDQAHLQGLLHQISGLGLTLIGLATVDEQVDGAT